MVASLPPARGAWRIEGAGAGSSAVLSHQIARPLFCDSISSGWSWRYLRMNLVRSDSYISASFDRDPLHVLGPGVVGGGADDLAVGALLDDVRRPAAGARDDEHRREHGSRHAEAMVGHRAVPVEVGEHVLFARHDVLQPLRDVEQPHVLRLL